MENSSSSTSAAGATQASSESTAPQRRSRGKLWDWKLSLATFGVVVLLLISLSVGEFSILSNDFGWEMFSITRIPRTVALVLSGAAMAICGLVMQLLTQNRFVEPTTTGTTEWAGLGLLTCLILFPQASVLVKMIVAVFFAFIGTMVFFMFLRRVTLRSSMVVPIVGIMLGSVVSAVSSFIALSADALQQLGIWFMGSFTSVYKGQS